MGIRIWFFEVMVLKVIIYWDRYIEIQKYLEQYVMYVNLIIEKQCRVYVSFFYCGIDDNLVQIVEFQFYF